MSNSRPIAASLREDTSGLILEHLTTAATRHAAEAEAMSRAYDKYVFRARRKKSGSEWLTDNFIRKVHAEMFGAIWSWGGRYRKIRLQDRVEPQDIHEQIHVLCRDFYTWDDNRSMISVLEVAARLQHRLTRIHPFTHGNGQHARLLTDIFFYSRQHRLPQWPQIQLMARGNEIRVYYMTAMRQADEGNITPLMTFIEDCLYQSN